MENQNTTDMKPVSTHNGKSKSNLERELYHQLWKKRKQIKDLKLRNLIRTNLQLLKNLDVSNSVLF
jgi:mevalonate kinase